MDEKDPTQQETTTETTTPTEQATADQSVSMGEVPPPDSSENTGTQQASTEEGATEQAKATEEGTQQENTGATTPTQASTGDATAPKEPPTEEDPAKVQYRCTNCGLIHTAEEIDTLSTEAELHTTPINLGVGQAYFDYECPGCGYVNGQTFVKVEG